MSGSVAVKPVFFSGSDILGGCFLVFVTGCVGRVVFMWVVRCSRG